MEAAPDQAAPLLAGHGDDAVQGAVDYEGRPVDRSRSGGWRSALFIIGVEVTERFAYYGIASNLISYLTGPLRQSTAAAAANVNVWSGVASLLPLLGAFVADSYLGRYWTILFASLLYILGLGMLSLSASLSFLRPPPCVGLTICPTPSGFQVFFFYASLYLVALAQGGHKPCVQAFGADQFDVKDPVESKSKSSFFNWWYFGICAGTMVALGIVSYIQDNVSWGLGFGIPCIVMAVGLFVFLLGTRTYRFISAEDKNPFVSLAQVYVAAARRSFQKDPTIIGGKAGEILHLQGSSNNRFKFLDRVIAISSINGTDGSGADASWSVCTAKQVEDAKTVLQLVPIWATCLIYAVVFAQSSTFFTKQGSTMDRRIGSSFKIPPAALQSFISLSIVLFIPIYDRVLVPVARAFRGKPSGITMLQRIGTGMFLSALSMVVAAVVEKWRLGVARDSGLVDDPSSKTLPMSVWWLAPQYILFGVADVFTMVGLQEFFYDQVPDALRSVGLALYLSIFGIGNFVSGFMISAIDKATRARGDSWFATNLNRAHLDYFYWLLAGLSLIELGLYLFFAKSYIYKTDRRSSAV